MKLRTISDSVRHSTSTTNFRRCAYTAFGAPNYHFKITIFLPFKINRLEYIDQVQSSGSEPLARLKTPRFEVPVSLQVPVSAASARAGNAPWATARFTAERMANRDAVMMLLCMPAPNRVRRERVVISI